MSATVLSDRPPPHSLLENIAAQNLPPSGPTADVTRDNVAVVWISAATIRATLQMLKDHAQGHLMLFDLTAIDERERIHREGQPSSSFTVVYHLMSLDSRAD